MAVNGKGYTDDGEAGQVIVFDLKTFKVLKRIKAQDDADGIAVDPTSGHVFVIEGDSKSISVIDPKSDQVIDTIQTGGGLEAAVAGGNGKLYVNGSEKKEMIRIDTASNKVDAHWPIPDCTSPHGLAIDTAGASPVRELRQQGDDHRQCRQWRGGRHRSDRPRHRQRGVRSQAQAGLQFQWRGRHHQRDPRSGSCRPSLPRAKSRPR